MPSHQRSVASLLRKAGVPCLLVSHLPNIFYLSGCRLSAGRMLLTKDRMMLYVDARYSERARKEGKKTIVHRPYEKLHDDLMPFPSIGIEAEHVTLAQEKRWKKQLKNKKLVHTLDLLEGLRRCKTTLELKSIQRACSITKVILRIIPSLLKLGITEQELAWKIFALAHQKGADELAFSTIVGFGPNTSIPHHEPSDRKLKKGDIVQIDMGVKVDGYCSDYSRVFFKASPTKDQKNAYDALLQAKNAAEKILKPGVTNHELDHAAREVLRSYDLDRFFTHALGHGVGIDIHEGVTLSSKTPKTKILKNEVVTIEPGLYFPGKWGMRVEDTHIVI